MSPTEKFVDRVKTIIMNRETGVRQSAAKLLNLFIGTEKVQRLDGSGS